MSKFTPTIFPKIHQYRREADLIHSVRRVVCLEKIDGTNTRVGAAKSAASVEDIVIGGRDLMEWESGFSQPYLVDLFRRDVSFCRRLLALVKELGAGVVLYGETCGGKIQSMGYLYGPRPHFLLFAATIGGVWLSYKTSVTAPAVNEDEPARSLPSLVQLAAQLSLSMPPCVYEGEPSVERLAPLIERPSQHAVDQGFDRRDVENLQEGIVLWSDPLLLDPFGAPLVCKWKHPKRRETIEVEEETSKEETPTEFAARVILPERLRHAISALQEAGRWSDVRAEAEEAVVRRVVQDVAREVPEYQTQLGRFSKKEVRAALEAAIRKVFALVIP